MIELSIKDNGHEWSKQNLVTLFDGKKHFDSYKCEKCGIKGKSYTLGMIIVKSSYSKSVVLNCTKAVEAFNIPLKIKITQCRGFGKAFGNLNPGSEHEVVTPPDGYSNDESGVWVMGVGEPVKVLASEYEIVSP